MKSIEATFILQENIHGRVYLFHFFEKWFSEKSVNAQKMP